MTARSLAVPRSAAATAAPSASLTAGGSTTSPPTMASRGTAVAARPITRSRPDSARATTTRAAPAASSTPVTRGPAGASRERSLATTHIQTLADSRACCAHRFGDPRGRATARRGALRAAAASPLDDRLHRVDDRVRVHGRGKVLRDRHEEGRPFAARPAEDHHTAPQTFLQAVRELLQLIEIGIAHVLRDDPCGADLLSLREQRLGDRVDAGPLHRDELLFETFAGLLELRDRFGQPRRRDAERGRGAGGPIAELAHLAKRSEPGHGLDAPDAGADRLLLRDQEEPDVAGAVAVRPAAQLARRAGLHDADLIGVLLVEEVHRAGGEGFLQRH